MQSALNLMSVTLKPYPKWLQLVPVLAIMWGLLTSENLRTHRGPHQIVDGDEEWYYVLMVTII